MLDDNSDYFIIRCVTYISFNIQSICFFYLFFHYQFSFRVKSILFSEKGVVATYRSGWTDCYPWEKLRRLDSILGYMVFSENNYLIFDGLSNRKVIDALDKLSNGKVREKRRFCGLRLCRKLTV